nr:hypothetical protein Itr_chr02CG04850 [Ipomoea trifida]
MAALSFSEIRCIEERRRENIIGEERAKGSIGDQIWTAKKTKALARWNNNFGRAVLLRCYNRFH